VTTLEPNHFTDYKTSREVKSAYLAGDKFLICKPTKQSGIACTCRDYIGETITIVYHRQRRMTTVKFNELQDARYTGENNE